MMIKLYSVYDKEGNVFCAPFKEVNDNAAIRGFKVACRNTDTLISKFPQDYDLYAVGEFNENTGEYNSFVKRIYNGFTELAEKGSSENEEN